MAHIEDTRLPAPLREALVDDPDFLRNIVQAVLQRLLEAEITEHVQAAPFERSEKRRGYRNGYRDRQLRTRVGRLHLLVPMDGVSLSFSRPGKPTDNAFIESFNGSFRDECLNINWFLSLEDAREKIGLWR